MAINIETLEEMPVFVSTSKATLKSMGGDLDSLYDNPRAEDPYYRSRQRGHACRKDRSINGSRFVDERRARRQVRALMGK